MGCDLLLLLYFQPGGRARLAAPSQPGLATASRPPRSWPGGCTQGAGGAGGGPKRAGSDPHLWLPEASTAATPGGTRKPWQATGPPAAAGGAAPRSAFALSVLPTPVEAARPGLPAGGPGRRRGRPPSSRPGGGNRAPQPLPPRPEGSGDTDPPSPALRRGEQHRPPSRPAVGCLPLSPATAATSRSAAAHSPSKRSRGIAMLRFSSIVPAPPSSPLSSRRREGLPPPAQGAAATAAKAVPRRRPPPDSPGRLRGRSKFWLWLRPGRAAGGDGAVGRVGSGAVRCGADAAAERCPPAGAARRLLNPCRSARPPVPPQPPPSPPGNGALGRSPRAVLPL